jgi:hypothetical protein
MLLLCRGIRNLILAQFFLLTYLKFGNDLAYPILQFRLSSSLGPIHVSAQCCVVSNRLAGITINEKKSNL